MEVNIIKAIEEKRKKRVCAYVRVSTNTLDQLNSFENQKKYWDKRFRSDDTVKYMGLFTDEGISGNKTKQRKGFMEVIKLARLGEIDTVFTKSFSRFSRNETDGLESITLLASYGVNVFFEKENLDSSDESKKFLLNILAKVSEDNIESTSKNIKMSLRNRIKSGKIVSGKCYGYKALYDKTLSEYVYTINEEESKTVKLIFNLYSSGMGMDKISKRLYELNIKSPTGKEIWSQTGIKYVLTNEKYIGNVLLQKYYSHNFKKIKNNNEYEEVPQVLVENNHEPIIDKELFNRVKELLQAKSKFGKPNIIRAFTGKVICGDCGHSYIHRVHYNKEDRKYDYYDCGFKIKKKQISTCKSRMIKEKCLYKLFNECFNEALTVKPENSKLIELETQKVKLQVSEKNLNIMYAKRYITNLKWTYRNKFKEGKVYLNTVRFLGFTKDENKKIVISHKEAEIVKRIYREFVGGKTYNEIARELTNEKIISPGDIEGKGKSWHSSTIFSILKNEKYMGDAILQKTFSVDFLSKRQKNEGQVDSVEVNDCLLEIIPKKLWDMAQLEIEKRKGERNYSSRNGKYSSKYAFSGKIICGCCNSKFRRHAQWSSCNGKRIKTPVWVCQNKQLSKNKECQNLPIKEAILEQAFVETMRRLFNERGYFIKTLKDNIESTIEKCDEEEAKKLQSEIDKESKLMLKLNEDLSNGIIEQAEYLTQFDELAKTIDNLILRQKAIKSQETEDQVYFTRMSEMAELLKSTTSFETFDSTIFMNMVENIKVISKHRIIITFKCGFEYEMEI